MYKYAPIEDELTHYWMGNDTYMENFCWPGPTPFYSNFMQYPDNLDYALLNNYKDILAGWTSAYLGMYAGLPSNNPAFEGPVERRAWSNIYEDTKQAFTGYMADFINPLKGENKEQ